MDAIHGFAREGDMTNLLKCIENGVSVNLKGELFLDIDICIHYSQVCFKLSIVFLFYFLFSYYIF